MSHQFKVKAPLTAQFVENFIGIDTLKVSEWETFKENLEETYVYKPLLTVEEKENIHIIKQHLNEGNVLSYQGVCDLEKDLYDEGHNMSAPAQLEKAKIIEEIPLLLMSASVNSHLLYFSETLV